MMPPEENKERDRQELTEENDYRELRSAEEDAQMVDGDGMDVAGDSGNSYNTSQVVDDRLTPDKGQFGHSTRQQHRVSTASPMPEQWIVPLGNLRIRRGKVSQNGDWKRKWKEMVMSCLARIFNLQMAKIDCADDLRDKTPPGTVQVLPTSNQTTSPLSYPSQTDNINYVEHDSESGDAAEAVVVDKTDVDPLDKFLPPPPKAKCSEELQRKINKFLEYKKAGKIFNAEVRNRKDYRNPDFLLHAVRYRDIDHIGSYFSKDVFDPHGYDNSDYCDEIGVSTTAASGLNSISLTADAITHDGRSNEKSKWDKVDGDRKNPPPLGMQDPVYAVGIHATVISASNAAAGYPAFAQQRREAEGKRSSERN